MRAAMWVRCFFIVGALLWAPACDDPVEPNRGPATMGSIPAQSVFVADTVEIVVSGYFSDPDGDALSYSAQSSDATVVSAAASAGTVRVIGLTQGTATITVTATDGGGLSATQSFTVTVPNRGPEAVDSIAAMETHVGESAHVVVPAYFSDPDGDSLSYAAESSDTGVVAATVSGDTVRVAGTRQGTATITVTATDGGGLSATQSFTVAVPNRGPEAVDSIAAMETHVGESAHVVVPAYFSDPDGDSLSYAAESSDTGVVAATVSGDTVRVAGTRQGTATITVTATDGGGLSATQSFTVTVPNRGPEAVDSIAAMETHVGESAHVVVPAYFSDPDGDSLSYAAESSDTGVVAATVSGDTVRVAGTRQGTATITVTATDGGGLSATQSFTVTVPNRGPEAVDSIAAMETHVGESAHVVVPAYFSDPDGDLLSYAAESSDTGVVAATVSGDTVRVAGTRQGTATITVTATDPGGLSATQSFTVAVPNRAPEAVDSIAAMETHVGESAHVVVPAYFSDPDGDSLSYAAESSDTGVVAATVSGDTVRVAGGTQGTAIVTVTATDGGGLSATQSFTVAVPNRAPEAVDSIAAMETHVGESAHVVVPAYFSDPDGDLLSYAAASSDTDVVAATVSGDTVRVAGGTQGTAIVTVTATDGGGLSATQSFTVAVPNRGPEAVDSIAAMETYVGESADVVVAAYFSDPDGDSLSYAAESSDTDVVAATVSGDTVRVAGGTQGTAIVAVTATDGGGLSATQSFTVTVPNRAPEAVDSIAAMETYVGESADVVVPAYFSDPDGDSLSYAAESSDTDVVAATVSGDTVRVAGGTQGTAIVTVTATDGGGLSATQSFTVTVPNRGPEAVDSIAAMETYVGESAHVVAAAHFSDPDGDSLSYTAESSDTGVVAATVSGDTVRVAGGTQGTATVTVTATDLGGLFVTQSFTVTVPNRGPETVDSIPAMEIPALNQATVIVSGYFTDPDNDSLRYEAESSNTGIATVSVLADTVRVSGVVEGNATITVTAVDPDSLSATQDFSVEIFPDPQREILKTIYDEMNGPNWRVSTNWLTDAPLNEWYGVTTNDKGQVTKLELRRNYMWDVEIPPEIGELTSLEYLMFELNGLIGPIPPEIGNLTNLTHLYLSDNDITGPLPPEIGNLTKLVTFMIRRNDLDGSLPPELGNLTELLTFYADHNKLSGPIPKELGNLRELSGGLLLNHNQLSGPIPPELGNLWRVDWFWLQNNQLTGSIPKELGQLAGASEFNLSNNNLTDSIPEGLGGLARVNDLFLHNNDLSGSLPANLSNLENLENLTVTNNPKMSGPISEDFTEMDGLVSFLTGGTEICAPDSDNFHDWLRKIPKRRVHICDREVAQAYLVQSAQERNYPVPLVPNRKALLRVFVTATKTNSEDIPKVVATFYVDDEKSHEVTIASKAGPIPTEVDESSLARSSNIEIAGSEIEPGLEMVVEIDPDGTLEDSLLTTKRIPSEGRFKFEVDDLPSFDLTLVPFLWEEDPDSAVIDHFEEMEDEEEEHELLQETYDMLPLDGMSASMHDPVMSSTNYAYQILREVRAMRAAENGSGYWMGSMTGRIQGAAGMAYVGAHESFVRMSSGVIAHELGHNLNNRHAPCALTPNPDPSFPEPDGSIGVWGYDHRKEELVNPDTPDFMSYCSPTWVSGYYYTNMVRYRVFLDLDERREAPAPGVLVWGGVDGDGNPSLEPAFVIDAPPSWPRRSGPYRLTGEDASGARLFSFPFAMDSVADGEVGAADFAFILPVEPEWAGSLESITLTAPGGSVSLDRETDTPMAIVRDTRNGQIRAFLRGRPEPPAVPAGFEVYWTRGIPGPEAWAR